MVSGLAQGSQKRAANVGFLPYYKKSAMFKVDPVPGQLVRDRVLTLFLIYRFSINFD